VDCFAALAMTDTRQNPTHSIGIYKDYFMP
jgi:hypothetical protein